MLPWLREHAMAGARNVVYGSIVALALIIVLDLEETPALPAAATIAGALVGVAIAEAYADYVQEMLSRQHTLAARERVAILEGVGLHLATAVPPIALLLLAAAGALPVATAYTIAEWAGVLVLGFFSIGAYRLAGVPPGRSLLAGTMLTGVGLVVVVVKLFIDH